MANLVPVSTFSSVYQIETSDLVQGGPGGIDNIPHQALLNRTEWLNDKKVSKDGDTITGRLDIVGTEALRLGGLNTYVSGWDAGFTSRKGFLQFSPDYVRLMADSGTDLVLGAGGDEVLHVDAQTGRVTVGSVNPGSARVNVESGALPGLDVYRTDAEASANGIRFLGADRATVYARIGYSTNELRLDGSQTVRLVTANTTRVYVTSDGAVGIGTTSPEARLHVTGQVRATQFIVQSTTGTEPSGPGIFEVAKFRNNPATDSGACLSITAGTAGLAALSFGDADGMNRGMVIYDNADDSLELRAAGSGKLTLTAGGVARDASPAANDSSTQVATTAWVRQSGMPAGMVVPFAGPTPPAGWVECNGGAYSRTAYASLFSVIGTIYGAGNGTTTFNVPDLRAEFVRGWDNGRGVDVGRTLGSSQGDQNKAHVHDVNGYDPDDTGTPSYLGGGVDPEKPFVIQTQSSGGSEARPRNVALMYCIKT